MTDAHCESNNLHGGSMSPTRRPQRASQPCLLLSPYVNCSTTSAKLRATNRGLHLEGSRFGRPLNLDQFARLTIKPLLKMVGITWRGYYACRRGLGTVATEAIHDPQGAAGMLRHKGIETAAKHYIGIGNPDTVRAMAEFERLWQNEQKQLPSGELVERLNTPVLKTGIPETVSGVRIPHSPPVTQ